MSYLSDSGASLTLDLFVLRKITVLIQTTLRQR